MFRGRYEYTIDAKGRMSIPAKFRDVVRAQGDDRIVVTNALDHCLVAYTTEDWRRIEEDVRGLSDVLPEHRHFKRFFIGAAQEIPIDKQGRILVPASLRGYADLDHDIVLQGLIDKFEVWSRERWDKEIEVAQSSPEDMARALAQSGLKI